MTPLRNSKKSTVSTMTEKTVLIRLRPATPFLALISVQSIIDNS